MRFPLTRSIRTSTSVCAATAVALIALQVGDAMAAKKKTHRFTEQSRAVLLDANTGIAEITGGQSGKSGTEIFRFTLDGLNSTGTFDEYNSHGSFYGRLTSVATVQPDGSLTTEANEKIKGGTGRYAGARGTIAETCTSPTIGSTLTCTREVVIKY